MVLSGARRASQACVLVRRESDGTGGHHYDRRGRSPVHRHLSSDTRAVMAVTVAADAVLICRRIRVVPTFFMARRFDFGERSSRCLNRADRRHLGPTGGRIRRGRDYHRDQHQQDGQGVQDKMAIGASHQMWRSLAQNSPFFQPPRMAAVEFRVRMAGRIDRCFSDYGYKNRHREDPDQDLTVSIQFSTSSSTQATT